MVILDTRRVNRLTRGNIFDIAGECWPIDKTAKYVIGGRIYRDKYMSLLLYGFKRKRTHQAAALPAYIYITYA